MKIRFIEPGNRPYRPRVYNSLVYDRFIRTPSLGINILATIVHQEYPDTLMYSESISKIPLKDVLDAEVIFIGFFTFAAERGYELADYFRKNASGLVVIGGLHASMNPDEAIQHCDYVMLGEGDELILPFLSAIREGQRPHSPGFLWRENGINLTTGKAIPPENINTLPNRSLVYRYKEMAGHNTIWPLVHASRGCPHNCDYCALVRHFGHRIRTRSPENVIADIRYSIDFFEKSHVRIFKNLWITDDNFFADRDWAKSVLIALINAKTGYNFNVQARYEVGFDNEMLELLKKAGFFELDLGIEFIDDESFEEYHKKSTKQEIIESIKNIRKHGISVRGLFILGSDHHKKGCGKQLADFVIENHIQGVLIQCMYFIPGTPVYEKTKDRLIHTQWSKYNGNTVHYPKLMTPYELQLEHIDASRRIYSLRRLFHAIIFEDFIHKILFVGEFFWHISIRADLKKELKRLKAVSRINSDQQ
jgi:radical SAM superfamily enzyme YgiQ (UPF0313 family)